jgi:hypothetical protein
MSLTGTKAGNNARNEIKVNSGSSLLDHYTNFIQNR